MRSIAIALLRGYQIGVSSWRPACCRFAPSCSDYAIQAVRRYGVFVGTGKAVRRLLRCHPFSQGGLDPLK